MHHIFDMLILEYIPLSILILKITSLVTALKAPAQESLKVVVKKSNESSTRVSYLMSLMFKFS